LTPENSEESFVYGDITRIPFLSFWLNARVINLNFTGVEDYVILRFFNLIISVGSLIVVYLTSKEVIKKKYYNLLPVFLLANTLMFVFLSSAVSYDNLSNFFIYLTIYYFVKYIKYRKTDSFLFLIVFQILALLTKFTIAPVVFIEVILILISFLKKGGANRILKEIYLKYKILGVILLFSLSLGVLLYGVNFFKYGQVQVKCEKILTVEQCMRNGVYSRDKSMDLYDFSNLSEFIEILKERITPVEYLGSWILSMTQKTFGILGHQVLLMPAYFSNIYIVLGSILLIITTRAWKKEDILETNLIIISLFYFLVLLIYQNYWSYIIRGLLNVAVQGRYLFPVLPLIYMVFSRYLKSVNPKWLRNFIVSLLILVFLLGCIPFFSFFVTEVWFS
jgi:hypothetical protein